MILVWIALALAALVLLLALRRPFLARLGIQYARQRPKQTALIVAGLMITTTVLAAAGITADSSAASYRESILGRIHLADAVIWSDRSFAGEGFAEAVRDHPQLAQAIDRTSAAIRTTLPVESGEGGRGDPRATVWGIDPATFGAIALLEAAEGSVPKTLSSWKEGGVLVNRAMALQAGVSRGDAFVVYVPREEVTIVNSTTWNGTLTASLGVGGPIPFAHTPQDDFQWDHDLPETTYFLEIDLVSTSNTALLVQALSPSGERYQAQTEAGQAHIELSSTQEPLGGRWNLSVHSSLAVGASFTLTAGSFSLVVREPDAIETTVLAVVHDKGSDPLGGGPAAFLPLPRVQEALGQPGRINTVLISLVEGIDDESLERVFQEAVSEAWVEQALPNAEGGSTSPPRADLIRLQVDEFGKGIEEGMRSTFLAIGSFTIVAGLLLVAVLMALLVEERKPTLAAMRAIGAKRGHVATTHVHEGAGYSVFAAIAGLIAGGLLAMAMTSAARATFDAEGGSVVMVFRWGTIATAAAAGFALTIVVIAGAAWWTSRIPIAAALRNEPGDPRQGRVGTVVLFGILLAIGFLLSATAVSNGSAILELLGPCLVIIGLGGIAGRFVDRGAAFSIAGILVVVYVIVSFSFAQPATAVEALVIPLRVVLLGLAAAVVAAYLSSLHRAIGWLLERIRGLHGVATPAFAHMRHRPGRAAMTIAILGTVLMVLTALGTLFASFAPVDYTNAGGYSVLGDTLTPLPDPRAYLADHPPRSGVDPFRETAAWVATPWLPGAANFYFAKDGWNGSTFSMNFVFGEDTVGVTPEFAASSSWRASALDPRFSSAREALEAVTRDPGSVVVSDGLTKSYFRDRDRAGEPPEDEPLSVGDTLRAGWRSEARSVRVVAVLQGVGTAGAFVHPDLLGELSGSSEAGTRIWSRPSRGASDADVAAQLEAGFRSTGMQASAVKEVQKESQRQLGTLQAIISVFLWLGLVIGLVALALVTTRNVILRRREVGVMRALGAQPWHVMATFGIETLYVVGFAIVIGLGGGLLLARSVLALGDSTLFGVNWAGLALLHGGTLVVAIAAAAWPAWTASRMAPAEAVRHAE